MPPTIRPAQPNDIPALIDLLKSDAAERCAHNPELWRSATDAGSDIETSLAKSLGSAPQPVQEFWNVSIEGNRLTGAAHSMLLPVPPIYAGLNGEPGLLLPDCYARPDAVPGTKEALFAETEATLRAAGARILLATFVTGADWKAALAARGYEPLTLYLARTGLEAHSAPKHARPAIEADVPGIVARSAEHRDRLSAIDRFWDAHAEADLRFDAWMRRSLTLTDRDMFVSEDARKVQGYAIAQPGSRLHFPVAHEIEGIGVLDDFYHTSFQDIQSMASDATAARDLLRAAETAFVRRGKDAAFVVCPEGWRSKAALLRQEGYKTAMVWLIKR